MEYLSLGLTVVIMIILAVSIMRSRHKSRAASGPSAVAASISTPASSMPESSAQLKPVAKTASASRPVEIGLAYRETSMLLERLHRRLLDVLKDDLDRRERTDINAVRSLLLYNIGDKELSIEDLCTNYCYLESDTSRMVEKLIEGDFLQETRSQPDPRSGRVAALIKLTDKGQDVRREVRGVFEKHLRTVEHAGGIGPDDLTALNSSLRRLERFWIDQVVHKL